jgi:hypothetical protein
MEITSLLRRYNLQNTNIKIVKDENKYQDRVPQSTSADKELYKSSLGTPVVADVTLKGGTYTDNNGRTITFADIVLATVLVNVSQSKRIILTEIQGRDGTVKEYIGLDDYNVSIDGILTGPNGHYPIEEVAIIREICKAPIPIQVVSRYLQNLDIFNLVIKDFSFDQEPGGYSKQNFSLQCLSDTPVELIIIT